MTADLDETAGNAATRAMRAGHAAILNGGR